MREPNILLDALIDEAGMSHDGLASRVNQAGARDGLMLLYDHASVRRWIRDATIPRGRAPELICEVLSMRLGRTVTLADAGLGRGVEGAEGTPLAKAVDAAAALWRSDFKQASAIHAAQPVQGAAAIVPVFEWENPPDDLDVTRRAGSRVSAEHVRALMAARLRYERMYREAHPVPGHRRARGPGRDLRLRRRPAGSRATVLLPGAPHGQGVGRPRLRRIRRRPPRQPGSVPGEPPAGNPVRRDRPARRPRRLVPGAGHRPERAPG
jgi:hypothetical protein